jgi:mRNA-degrading endonuclease RelE of RelBE toxin-antitoxin system
MPVWTIEFDRRAEKEFRKLDQQTQKRIGVFLRDKMKDNPKGDGQSLAGLA